MHREAQMHSDHPGIPGKLVRILASTAALLMLTGGGRRPPDNAPALAIDVVGQEQQLWCWAATGQMIMAYFGKIVTQGQEANHRLGRSDCKNDPVPWQCNSGGLPEFDHYGFLFDSTAHTALSWDGMREELASDRTPVAFEIVYNGGGSHIMVARGFGTFAKPTEVDSTRTQPLAMTTERVIMVNDPLPVGTGDVAYMAFEYYYSGSDHTAGRNYYNIRRKP
jgi:hypothetical protein